MKKIKEVLEVFITNQLVTGKVDLTRIKVGDLFLRNGPLKDFVGDRGDQMTAAKVLKENGFEKFHDSTGSCWRLVALNEVEVPKLTEDNLEELPDVNFSELLLKDLKLLFKTRTLSEISQLSKVSVFRLKSIRDSKFRNAPLSFIWRLENVGLIRPSNLYKILAKKQLEGEENERS